MCLDPVSMGFAVATAAITATSGAIATGLQVQAQNKAAVAQYQFQQQQQQLATQNAIQAEQSSNSMQALQGQRQAVDAFNQSQQAIIQNQQKQAQAVASGATMGISGTSLQNLFNDYQVTAGNIASNLNQSYQQINQNTFFQDYNNYLEAQSRINQATPAPPYLASFNPAPAIVAGIGSGIGSAASSYKQQNNPLNNYLYQSPSTPTTNSNQFDMLGGP